MMTRTEHRYVQAVAELHCACVTGVWPTGPDKPSGILSYEESVALADLQILNWPTERIRELWEIGRTYGDYLARVRQAREAASC